MLFQRNLEAWRQQHLTEEEIEEIEASERDARYRDRAKERRKKHGDVEPVAPPRDERVHPKKEWHGKKRSADSAEAHS
jgi:hypothetical protein